MKTLQNITHLVFFGECMREYRADGTQHFGGDTFNAAWYCKIVLEKLGILSPIISYATGLGHDQASIELNALMKTSNIGDDFCNTHPQRMLGEYWVINTHCGERRFEFKRSESAATAYFSRPQRLIDALKNCTIDALFISGISLAILNGEHRELLLNAIEKFKHHGGIVLFDNNFRSSLWNSEAAKAAYIRMMMLSDIAFLTNDDETAVYGTQSVADIIACHHGRQSITGSKAQLVIRQGAMPCIIKNPNDEQIVSIKAITLPKHAIVDTCAAGDAFAGAYVAAIIANITQANAACIAHNVAASVIQHYGALQPKNTVTIDIQEYAYGA